MVKTGPVPTLLYTQSVDAELAATVRRIAGNGEAFSTEFLGFPGNTTSVRLEAWQNPNTSLWKIDRYTHFLSGDSETIKQETELNPGLCFFDALHYCATFQRTEEELGKQPVQIPGERWKEIPSYKEAAKSANQAIDEFGGMHPCAFGRILTPGFFSADSLDTAHKTKDAEPAPALKEGTFIAALTKSLQNAPAVPDSSSRLLEQTQRKHDVIKKLYDVINAGTALTAALKNIVKNEFKAPVVLQYQEKNHKFDRTAMVIGKVLKTTLSFGLNPAVSYIKGETEYSCHRPFKIAHNDFNQAVKALPECAQKKLVEEFSKAVGFAYYMEQAKQIYVEAVRKDSLQKTLKKGLPYIEKAGETIGLGKTDIERLKAEFIKGALHRKGFQQDVCESWSSSDYWNSRNGLKYDLTRHIETLENAGA